MVLQCRNSCYKPDRKLDSSVQPFGEEKYEAKLKKNGKKRTPQSYAIITLQYIAFDISAIYWVNVC